MRKQIKIICLAILLAFLAVPFAHAFVILGPGISGGTGGDAWEAGIIGYGSTAIAADVGTPKNIGEEYRRVTPIMYYATDASFLDFFGLAGQTNIDAAMAIMNGAMCGQTNTPLFLNSPTNGILAYNFTDPYTGTPISISPTNNLDSYKIDLGDFPLESQQYNYTAQTALLTDLRSSTLELMTEQMGLGQPERFVWTLHDRYLPPGGKCPLDEEYLVVQRNFDIIDSPLNQVQYSPYVNGTLYSYDIIEFCTGPNPLAFTLPFAVDNYSDTYTAVASFELFDGGYYTSLTRDDVGGLRYLLTSNNINYEATAPSGGQLVTTNLPTPISITTLPFSLLFSQSVTSPPSLFTNFPGLTVLSVITNIGPQITTNITPYFTNQSVLPVYNLGGYANITNLSATNLYFFTNQPGPTIITYDKQSYLAITTLDLAVFSDAIVTNDPVTLLSLYPGLQILDWSVSPTTLYATNYISYLTNLTGAPYSGNPIAVTVAVSTNAYNGNIYTYTFGNIFTNHYYTNRLYQVQSIWTTNLVGAAYGSPFVTVTNYTYTNIHAISGDFFLIPTNFCGFDVILAFRPNVNPPYATGPTNTTVFQGFTQTNTTNSFGLTRNVSDIYTNFVIDIRPGICEPKLQFGTNYTTNIVTTYTYYFGNIYTNNFYTNITTTIIITNIQNFFGGSPNQFVTNIIVTNITTSGVGGDFFIPSPDWCGYSILSTQLTTIVTSTNTITATNSAGTNGVFTETILTSFTNTTFLVQPIICGTAAPQPALREGIERVEFIRANYDSLLGQFFQPLTNYYTMVKVTNSQAITEFYQRVVTTPDFLIRAQDLVSGPSAIPTVGSVARNLQFDQSQILPGLAGPGTIIPSTTFTYNKAGDVYANGSLSAFGLSTNAFLSGLSGNTQGSFFGTSNNLSVFAWGSFDGSTNSPVVYPNGTSIANLINQLFISVSPSSVPDGTNGVVYAAQTFTVTGGQGPYVWAAPNFSVPGLSFNSSTQTLSGTPTGSGVFNFTIQVTDAVNRTVNLNYSITIH